MLAMDVSAVAVSGSNIVVAAQALRGVGPGRLVIKNTGAQDLTAASVLVGPDANSLATLDTATFGTLAAGAVAQLAIAAPIEYLKVIASCAAGTTVRASLALAESGAE